VWRLRFWRMFWDILKYNRRADKLLRDAEAEDCSVSEWLKAQDFGEAFIKDYWLPMAAALWSCTEGDVGKISVRRLLRFFKQHDHNKVFCRQTWYTIKGGSSNYIHAFKRRFADICPRGQLVTNADVERVQRAADGTWEVYYCDSGGSEEKVACDAVVFATHAPTTLKLLGDAATDEQRRVLSQFRYYECKVYIHTDPSYMALDRRNWGSWNAVHNSRGQQWCTYWLNSLQFPHFAKDVFATVVPSHMTPDVFPPPPRDTWLCEPQSWEHPCIDVESEKGRQTLFSLDVQRPDRGIVFAGAYGGSGFHEDGFREGRKVARLLMQQWARESCTAEGHRHEGAQICWPAPVAMERFPGGSPVVREEFLWERLARTILTQALQKLADHVGRPIRLHCAYPPWRTYHMQPTAMPKSSSRHPTAPTEAETPPTSPGTPRKAHGRDENDSAQQQQQQQGRPMVLTVQSPAAFWRMVIGSDIGLGVALQKAEIVYDAGFRDVLRAVALSSAESIVQGADLSGLRMPLVRPLYFVAHKLWEWTRANTIDMAKLNIAAHYDLGDALYERMLDVHMQYSCAVWQPGDTLAGAQLRKMDKIAQSLELKEGERVLEIGCGWGGLSRYLAQKYKMRVEGLTISNDQLRVAQAKAHDVPGVSYHLCDYRDFCNDERNRERFDAVVSIEMIEAVGYEYLGEYFNCIQNALKPKGRCLVQGILMPDYRFDSYVNTSNFINVFIFPGGILPSQMAILQAVKKKAPTLVLVGADEIGQSSYGNTLRAWRNNFEAKWHEICREAPGFDGSFRRVWNFYLDYCAAGFDTSLILNCHLMFEKRLGPQHGQAT